MNISLTKSPKPEEIRGSAFQKAQRMFNPERRHKYNAVAAVVDGKRFASKKEARVYGELTLLERAGEIKDLRCQHPIPLLAWTVEGPGQKISTYLCDFVFYDMKKSRTRYLDAKGMKTPLFNLKAKIVLANYGIEIETV